MSVYNAWYKQCQEGMSQFISVWREFVCCQYTTLENILMSVWQGSPKDWWPHKTYKSYLWRPNWASLSQLIMYLCYITRHVYLLVKIQCIVGQAWFTMRFSSCWHTVLWWKMKLLRRKYYHSSHMHSYWIFLWAIAFVSHVCVTV